MLEILKEKTVPEIVEIFCCVDSAMKNGKEKICSDLKEYVSEVCMKIIEEIEKKEGVAIEKLPEDIKEEYREMIDKIHLKKSETEEKEKKWEA